MKQTLKDSASWENGEMSRSEPGWAMLAGLTGFSYLIGIGLHMPLEVIHPVKPLRGSRYFTVSTLLLKPPHSDALTLGYGDGSDSRWKYKDESACARQRSSDLGTVKTLYKHSLGGPLRMLVNRLFLYPKIEYRVISEFWLKISRKIRILPQILGFSFEPRMILRVKVD